MEVSKLRRIIKVSLCLLLSVIVITAMTCVTDNAYAASKTKQMKVYTSVYKSGNTVYCCSTKGISKVNLKTGKVKLLKDAVYYYHHGFSDMKKKGKYLYYFSEWSWAGDTELYRLNTKTGKAKKIISGYKNKKITYIENYVISGKKIYVSGYRSGEDMDRGKYVKLKMKLNGKSKKKTSVKAKMIEVETNAKGYTVEEVENSDGDIVTCYLRTPSGKKYYLGTADSSDLYE